MVVSKDARRFCKSPAGNLGTVTPSNDLEIPLQLPIGDVLAVLALFPLAAGREVLYKLGAEQVEVFDFQRREQPGKVAGLLNRRAAGVFDIHTHGLRQDVGERGLAKTGRAAEQDVLEHVAPLFAGLLAIPTMDRYAQLDLSPQQQKDAMVTALRG